MNEFILGIDTGGTYTDGVLLDFHTREVLATTKTLTTKNDLTVGILEALDNLLPEGNDSIRLISISTTLATNAIAEGKGRPVALFLLGYDPELIKRFQLDSAFATNRFFYFDGGHDLHGEEQTSLDIDGITERAVSLQKEIESFAVSGYFSPFNPIHEQSAFKAINESTGHPVVLGHQLASKLNSVQRATTATLNASLLSILQEFMMAIRTSLEERSITAPLMVVRGDGALMSSDIGEKRPVETVHSGPAASAIGGRFLSEKETALVIDIGGTTTDIAVIDNGQVNIREEGTSVGAYKTAVQAAHIRSIGLGGDSIIRFDVEDRLIIGPSRVTPIAYLAHTNPYVAEKVSNLLLGGSKRTVDQIEFWYLLREPRTINNDRAREVLKMLENHPMTLKDILEKMELYHPLQFGGQTLVKEEIVGRSALTPTDLLHVTGQFSPWDKDAAQTATTLMARINNLSVDKLIEMAMTTITERIVAEVVSFTTGQTLERVPDYIHPDDLGLWLFEESLSNQHPYLGSKISLKIPIIGIGAPAEIFLPPVAEKLETELIIPPHYQVANAVGAVAGSVMSYEEAWVFPKMHDPHVVGYYVQARGGQRHNFSKIDEALEFAKKITGERALASAYESGAVDPHLEFEKTIDGAESYRVRAKAIGNPKLG